MKKWIDRILIAVGLIGGYGLMAAIVFLAVIGFGYLMIELAMRTLEEPSAGIILADFATVFLIFFVCTRQKVRAGFANFWKQVLQNK